MSKERIYLDTKKESMTADGLPGVVPDGHPSYHFFLFKHTFEGDYQESIGTCTWCVGHYVHYDILGLLCCTYKRWDAIVKTSFPVKHFGGRKQATY